MSNNSTAYTLSTGGYYYIGWPIPYPGDSWVEYHRHCPMCGHCCNYSDNFCGNCGHPLQDRYCVTCGSKLDE